MIDRSRFCRSSDPQFAEAHAVLGLVYAVLPLYTTEDREDTHVRARDAAEHALALNPELPEAYGALGDVAIHSMKYELAEALLERSLTQSEQRAERRHGCAVGSDAGSDPLLSRV